MNIGASTGLLPTKGLTLPLVSYGGSSIIIMTIAVAILIRIDFELRVDGVQAIPKARKTKRKPIIKRLSKAPAEDDSIQAQANHADDYSDPAQREAANA